MQVGKTPKRKLFDAARRAVFLEVFAATCNVRLAAAKAEICYGTVFRHRMKDAEFAAAWDAALQQGYAYLEARLLEEARYSPAGAGASSSDPSTTPDQVRGGPPPRSGEELEEFAEEHFDPELALTLLREHARRLPGSGDKRKRQRTTVTVATHEEVVAALTKRLKTFAVLRSQTSSRQGSGQAVRGRASRTE